MPGWRRFFVFGVAPALLVLAIALSTFKQCTALGKVAKNDIYDPSENGAGFVIKADSVLALLLKCVDNVDATDIESLNKRYKALEFALPFDGNGCGYMESSNLRLVGIHPEYIEDEDLKRFYYNSRLPQLLEQQAEHLGESFFTIRCKNVPYINPASDSRDVDHKIMPIEVESIKLIPSMFKVRMMKNPWTGTIMGVENCLFSDSASIYLTYGNSVLPIHNDKTFDSCDPVYINAIMNEGILLWTPPEVAGKQNVQPQPIDYYEYYRAAFSDNNKSHNISVKMQKERTDGESAHFSISYSGRKLRITHDCGLLIVGNKESKTYLNQVRAGDAVTEVPFENGMKILMYTIENNKLSIKLGEITLYANNPMTNLSYMTQSSIGADRFLISGYQTDLFTQQMLRGLSQHLSNRENIDSVKLAIDPLLSREFELEIKDYLAELKRKINAQKPARQVNDEYDMSVTILDLATGEVLATPFYTTLFDNKDFPEMLKLTTRNTSLSRRSVGSTFKPMEALAAVMTIPSLLDMNTVGRYGPPDFTNKRVNFLGRNVIPWAKNSSSHWGGCDFTQFISRSDDVYPVALVSFALGGKNVDPNKDMLPIDGNSYFTMNQGRHQYLRFKNEKETSYQIENQPFIRNFSFIYNVNYNDATSGDFSRTAELDMFKPLLENASANTSAEGKTFGLLEVSPEHTQLHFDRFNDGEDFRSLLVPWVLGQGDNMWNCVKLAEAWARMVGKRDVRASFIHTPDNGKCKSLVDSTKLVAYQGKTNFNEVWNKFLTKFEAAQHSGGLLDKMQTAVAGLNQDLVLFSKTGTPDAYNPPIDIPLLGGRVRKMDIGMYCFVLLKNGSYQNIRNNRQGKGIVCIVRVSRTYECHHCRPGRPCSACEKYWGLKSEDARNFFSANPDRLRKFYDMTQVFY